MKKEMKIVISTIFQNGGDATRAIEIAKIIRDYKPSNYILKIIFLTRGSLYENKVIEAGFELYRVEPQLEGVCYQKDFKTKFGELIGDENLAYDILVGEIKAYEQLQPDILLYGFWPIASIAKRMVIPNVKSIAFLPLPLTETFLTEELTFPDELYLSRLPISIQQWIMKFMPFCLKRKNPALKHSCIKKAAIKLGWNGKPLFNIFRMLESDLYLINDLPLFYHSYRYNKKVIFTGPLYAQSNQLDIANKEILKIIYSSDQRKKLFCTLGTSGNKKELFEIIKMFNTNIGMMYSGIVLAPPSICSVEECKQILKNKYVYVTDEFVPAKLINENVDLVISHGGQGTLQTAITSKKPLIGVATQPEQKINLEHLESFGAAIRITKNKWKAKMIAQKTLYIFKYYATFQRNVEILSQKYSDINTKQIIGNKIWEEVR